MTNFKFLFMRLPNLLKKVKSASDVKRSPTSQQMLGVIASRCTSWRNTLLADYL